MPTPTLLAIHSSPGGIPKSPIDPAAIDFGGVSCDGHEHECHQGKPDRAISLIDVEILGDLQEEGYDVHPGAMGENLTVQDLGLQSLHVGDRLTFSGGVELELTEERRPCFVLDSIDATLKKTVVGRCGYLAKVLTPGTLRPGESIGVDPATDGAQ
jgi:MOSC domain-containing protein YiiM